MYLTKFKKLVILFFSKHFISNYLKNTSIIKKIINYKYYKYFLKLMLNGF